MQVTVEVENRSEGAVAVDLNGGPEHCRQWGLVRIPGNSVPWLFKVQDRSTDMRFLLSRLEDAALIADVRWKVVRPYPKLVQLSLFQGGAG